MADYPKINGHKHDHSSIELSVTRSEDGAPRKFVAVAEITYRQGLTPGQVRGTAAQLLALTKGTLSAGEGTLVLPKEDAQELREVLGQGYMEKTSTITINYSALFSRTITDILKGVRLTEEETSSSGGTEDPINDTFTLMYVEGTRGGLSPVTPLNETPAA
jgi:hypothetical protein